MQEKPNERYSSHSGHDCQYLSQRALTARRIDYRPGHPNDRDRNAVFVARISQRDELMHRIDAADTDLERLRPSITEREVFTLRARPNKTTAQSGLLGLVRNYGHAREHLAQLQLTTQLYQLTSREARDKTALDACIQSRNGWPTLDQQGWLIRRRLYSRRL